MSEAEKKLLRIWLLMTLNFCINRFSWKSEQVLSGRILNLPRNPSSTGIVVRLVTYHLLCFEAFPVAFWCYHLEPAEFVFASLSEFPAPAEKGKREGKGTHVNEMNGKSLIIKVKVVQSIPAVVCTQWVEILSEGAFSKFWFTCNFISLFWLGIIFFIQSYGK